MKALWLAPVHYKGGSDVHPAPWVVSLAERLQDSGLAEITILNYQPRLESPSVSIEKNGVKYVFLKTPVPKVDYLTMYKKRIKIIREYVKSRLDEFDIIHVHGSEHQYEAVVHDLDKPVVMSMQGILTEYLKHLKHKQSYTYISWLLSSKYEQTYISKVDEFMCRTSFDTGFVQKHNPEARIHENWEMLRKPFFQDLFSSEPDSILHVGGTHPLKGMSLLLRAYDHIRSFRNVGLTLAGNADSENVQHIIDHYDLRNFKLDEIRFTGMLSAEALAQEFSKNYLLVHPTLIDNSPNSICEAQVAGLPVVATNVGGVGSLIEHGKTGLLCEKDPEEIAENIMALLDDRHLHARISLASKEMARKRHDPEQIQEKTIQIYRSIQAA